MSPLTKRTRKGAGIALRHERRKASHNFTSYPDVPAPSIAPDDEIEHSWEDFPADFLDDQWALDAWVVGADVHPDLWPGGVFGEVRDE
jgi:hypothetical protein